jgi:hypothetical protein
VPGNEKVYESRPAWSYTAVCVMSFVVCAGQIKTESVIRIAFYTFYFVSRDQILISLQHFIWTLKGSHKIFAVLVVCKIVFRDSVNFFLLVTCVGYNFFFLRIFWIIYNKSSFEIKNGGLTL